MSNYVLFFKIIIPNRAAEMFIYNRELNQENIMQSLILR
jgi:hypothetical protein